jgi:hypothetical protein
MHIGRNRIGILMSQHGGQPGFGCLAVARG